MNADGKMTLKERFWLTVGGVMMAVEIVRSTVAMKIRSWRHRE